MKKTKTFNHRNSFSIQSERRSVSKNLLKQNLKELVLSNEKELRDFRFLIKTQYPELLKEQKIYKLLLYLKNLNGVNPLISNKEHFMKEETKSEALIIIKNIIELLKQINIFLFYFRHYKMDDRIIKKIVPNLKFTFYKKDEILYKEGESSNKFYFLVKGKISLKKKVIYASEENPKFIEKSIIEEGSHFGDWDIIYDRKKKTGAFCVEDSVIISVEKETFKDYFEAKVMKIEAEIKTMLKNFLMAYMTLPAIKIERFIQNNIKTLFFKRNEVIYSEGEENTHLYMINAGEADLIQKFSKGEYSFLVNYQYSNEYLKEMAKRIDYRGEIRSANHPNYKRVYNDDDYEDKEKENNYNENYYTINKKYNLRKDINKNNKKKLNKSDESIKLDLLLERKNFQVLSCLKKGSLGGIEVCTGITRFKYSLISNSEFTSVFKIDLKPLDGEHLTEFMLNLLPMFIDLEKKIHAQIKKMKYIDSNILPDSCQKFNRKSKSEICFYKDEENDDIYKKNIQKIDNMFDVNEGGFIKMNDFNMKLQKKKNELKALLKDNIRMNKKADSFLTSYVNEQNSKLKYRGMKLITPVIPNYEIIENRFENKNNNKENDDIKQSNIYYQNIDGKNYYYLIDKNILLGKYENKPKNTVKNTFSKKSQEMFDKLFPKSRFSKYQVQNKKLLTLNYSKFKNKNFSYKKYFIENNNYMRDLLVQKNEDNIHCIDKNLFKLKYINKKNKNIPNIYNSCNRVRTISKSLNTKKMIFFDTGKYDIPLLTEINNY